MKRREFLARCGSMALLSLGLGTSGCLGAGTGNTRSEIATGAYPGATGTNTTSSGSLAGTCPRGRSCTSPQCQLWVDQNGDGRCDRGIIAR